MTATPVISVEPRAGAWWVLHGGTVLFIGAKAGAVAIARACAKDWRIEVAIAKGQP